MNFNREIHLNWNAKKTWILIGILAAITIGAGFYFFFFQNTFSKNDIALRISGPTDVVSGESGTWLVTFENKSEVPLENISLAFEYPSGVFDKEGRIKKREQKTIDALLPGEEKSENFSGIIFGTKEEIKEVKAFLVYSPKGLSTQFENQISSSMRISETSVVFSFEVPEKVNNDEDFPISIFWQSGFYLPLENSQVRFFLPDGFERILPKSEDEIEESGKIIFPLGTLNEGQGGRREIKGKIKGKVGEEKLFRADFGIFDEKLYEFIPLATVKKVVKIKSSTLDVFLKTNGESDHIASPGENLAFIVDFMNTGEDIYRQLNVGVEIESNVLDFSTVSASGGKIEGKKITFSSDNFPDLLFLGPYGKGSVGFQAQIKDYDSSFHPEHGYVRVKIIFGTVEKEFEIRVSSKISFSENIYYNLPERLQGKFNITGPNPLAVDQETALVVEWEIKNLGNSLAETKIETTLPDNVDFEGIVFPDGIDVAFDDETRNLILNIGSILPYTPSEIFAIQIKVKLETVPGIIMNETKLSAKDSFTDKTFGIRILQKSDDSIK